MSKVNIDQMPSNSRVRDWVAKIRKEHKGSILDRIGNTPLVEIKEQNPNLRVKIYAKLESFNPTGSLKDRIVLFLMADLVEKGKLSGHQIVVEATSGNTGISLAMIGAVLNRDILIIMPDDVSVERRKLIRAYGADLMLTPGELGTDGAIEKAQELAKEEKYVWLAQHYNQANPQAHYHTTGQEIVKEVDHIDAFVAPSGTTGTLMGVAKRLKEFDPSTKIVAVWPKDEIMGLRRPVREKRPGIYDESLIDEIIEIKDEDAKKAARELADKEGIFAGPSSGASFLGALQTAEKMEKSDKRKVIVALFPDGGEKYLSTDTFQSK